MSENKNTYYILGYSEGLASVKKDGKYGYVDELGRLAIPFIYDFAMEFSEGLACVEYFGKWGYIDKTGKEIIPFIYDQGYDFENGRATVYKNLEPFEIDKNGNENEIMLPVEEEYDYDSPEEFFSRKNQNAIIENDEDLPF